MSERYSKVFSLPENLYAEGAPVIIAAGALLKDNQTGRVVAQLKLRNISPKTIKAVTVRLFPMNTAGQPLGDAVRYEYLDLSSNRDADFGSKSAIPMPDKTTRSFGIRVAEVIFADNSAWNANDAAWEPLEKPEALDSRLDSEMVKQFQIEYGSRAKNFLLEQKDLWHCICGAVNRREETVCHSCQKILCDLRNIDLDTLEGSKERRLIREQEQATREAEAARENAKIAKRVLTIALVVVIVVMAIASVRNSVIIPNGKYKDAEERLNNGEIVEAAIAFNNLGSFRDSQQRSFALWEQIVERKTIAVGGNHTVGLKADGTVMATGYNEYGQCDVSDWTDIIALSAGIFHTVGLKADGTVVAAGDNEYGQCDVSDWTDVVAISTGERYTVGLRADSTVVATGDNEYGQCDVSDWTDVVAIRAYTYHTVGLRADGTVVAVGANKYRQCDVSDWTDIVALDIDSSRTVGLRADGTVVATNDNDEWGHDVSGWTDIVAVGTNNCHTVGLKADGTVVATGANISGECDVSGWTDIIALGVDISRTVGLRADGTVVAVGWDNDGRYDVSDWADIVAISTYVYHAIGLKADGTLVATGNNNFGQCNVLNWTDIKLP